MTFAKINDAENIFAIGEENIGNLKSEKKSEGDLFYFGALALGNPAPGALTLLQFSRKGGDSMYEKVLMLVVSFTLMIISLTVLLLTVNVVG